MKSVCNVKDFKVDEMWVPYLDKGEFRHVTRSGVIWLNIAKRLRQDSSYSKSINLFTDFHSFSSWCQDQYGYMHKENNGKYWSLDKDILVPGNTNYGPDKCLFVPQILNNLFETSMINKGQFLVGVYHSQNKKKFISRCRDPFLKKVLYLGTFDTAELAHKAWQAAKVSVIRNSVKIVESHEKLKEALLLRADLIESQMYSGKITDFNGDKYD